MNEPIPVPGSKPALNEIPGNLKGISASLTSIEGPGDEIPEIILEGIPDADDAQNVKNDEVKKGIKKALIASTSKISTGR